jgi:divalent metal cation (Fe/Co/Zn/Cd) transporter
MMNAAASVPLSNGAAPRERWVRKGLWLERVTIAWNLAEGAASIVAGVLAGSVALVGFGADSAIEVIAAVALLRRLGVEATGGDHADAGRHERRALWLVGITFFLLSGYIVIRSGWTLWFHLAPEKSVAGMVVTLLALVAMPLLARSKTQVGKAIGSRALVADAKETLACAWLAAITLAGLLINALFGWWWADPVAALLLVPFLVREGREAVEHARGAGGCCGCDDD